MYGIGRALSVAACVERDKPKTNARCAMIGHNRSWFLLLFSFSLRFPPRAPPHRHCSLHPHSPSLLSCYATYLQSTFTFYASHTIPSPGPVLFTLCSGSISLFAFSNASHALFSLYKSPANVACRIGRCGESRRGPCHNGLSEAHVSGKCWATCCWCFSLLFAL